MPEGFLDRVAAARQLSVGSEGTEFFVLDLGLARQGIDALPACNDDLLQSWGIDVAARRALSQQPRADDFDWAARVMPSESAALVFTLDVTERGRASDCRILVSSGNARLDRAFCNLATSRARFQPALNSAGEPVPSQFVTRMTWLIEGS